MSGAERTELREQAARAAFDAFYAEGTEYTEIERAMFLQVADAVLAILPGTDAEDAAAIRRVLKDAERWRLHVMAEGGSVASELSDVARLARLGQG